MNKGLSYTVLALSFCHIINFVYFWQKVDLCRLGKSCLLCVWIFIVGGRSPTTVKVKRGIYTCKENATCYELHNSLTVEIEPIFGEAWRNYIRIVTRI